MLVTPFYFGCEAKGRAAFRSLLEIGPYNDTTAALLYPEWNTAANSFCIKGGRKPSYGAGFSQMVPSNLASDLECLCRILEDPRHKLQCHLNRMLFFGVCADYFQIVG